MSKLTNRLNNRIEIYGKTQIVNELGEVDFVYGKIKSVWAAITPQGGSTSNGAGNNLTVTTSHKFIIRANAISNITNDMYFMFKGQRYDIKYFNPNYANRDSIEIFCELVVE